MSELSPNKRLGQHWLRDAHAIAAICDEASLGADDVVLEIGPGLGTLTSELGRRAARVIAVELDAELARELPRHVPSPNLEVVQADILRFDLRSLPAGYKVVANLPYYVTSKITRYLLEAANPPSLATLLVQREVAERMAAQPGALSILGVATQFYAEVRLGPVVEAELFTPPPQVDSQVITLTRRSTPLFADADTPAYFRVVRAGFSEKRKKLRSSLSGGLHLDKTVVDATLQRCRISPDARAQELSLHDWYTITKNLQKADLT